MPMLRRAALLALGSMYQEVDVLRPPMPPEDVSTPSPGLGLELNGEAVNRFRVEGFSSGRDKPENRK